MPEDMASQPPLNPNPGNGEGGQAPLTAEQVMNDAAAIAGNIVDAALATPEGQAAQAAAQIAAAAEAVGLPNTMPTAETAVTDVSSSLAQSNRGAVRVVASDAPQATPWPAPDQSEAFAFSKQSGTSPESTTAAAASSHAEAEQVAQAAAELSTNKSNVIVPTPYMRAAMKNVGDAIMNGTDNGETPRVIGANTIAQARTMVAASQAGDTSALQPTTTEAPMQNAALDAVLNEAYGDPSTHTVENAAVTLPQPAPGPTQTEVFDTQMAQRRAGATWPEIQTPAAGAAVPAEAQPTTTETGTPAPDMTPTTTAPVSTEANGETTTTPPAAEATVPPETTTTTTTEAPPTTPPSTTLPPSIPPTA